MAVSTVPKGIMVSNDRFRDLIGEEPDNPDWDESIRNRTLQFTIYKDLFIFPKDPRGKDGPTLEEFLRA